MTYLPINRAQAVAIAHHVATIANRPKVRLKDIPEVLRLLATKDGLLEGLNWTCSADLDLIEIFYGDAYLRTTGVRINLECRNGALIPSWCVDE